ncbi:hypothetical protein ACX0GZ_14000 [Sphingomonas aestuarii]
MKRSILTSVSVAALFAAVPAMAQNNTSTVNQTNAWNEAVVTQSGSNAQSTVQQDGDGLEFSRRNRVRVEQSGNGAESSINQVSGNRNRADVRQNGDSTSIIRQDGPQLDAEVNQTGDGNFSNIDQAGRQATVGVPLNSAATGVVQVGNNNSSDIDQNPTTWSEAAVSQFGNNNISNLRQETLGTNGGNENSSASVLQDGDRNSSTLTQTSGTTPSLLIANVNQNGDDNSSMLTQTGADNSASLLQDGNRNASMINQSGVGGNVDVEQFGNENDSFVTQESGATAIVRQEEIGNNFGRPRTDRGGEPVRANYSTINQGGGAAGAVADVDQRGQLNLSRVTQNGGAAQAEVTQIGIFNESTVTQNGASEAEVYQGGAYGDNRSVVTQNVGGASAIVDQRADRTDPTYFPTNDSTITQDSAATADVGQLGQQNVSSVAQLGGAAGATATVRQENTNAAAGASDINSSTVTQSALTTAFVEQIGEANTSTVNQTGASTVALAANIRQYGSDSTSTLEQGGSNNQASLLQLAGSSFNNSNITQTGSNGLVEVTQGGSGHLSNVTQGGANNSAFVDQSGSGHTSTISQGGSSNIATVTQSGGL